MISIDLPFRMRIPDATLHQRARHSTAWHRWLGVGPRSEDTTKLEGEPLRRIPRYEAEPFGENSVATQLHRGIH